MPFPQRSHSTVSRGQQSVLPTVRGVPWWGAVLIAIVVAGIGAIIDAVTHKDLGALFYLSHLIGCVVAALAVRRRALFTAAVQPPLTSFVLSVIVLYICNTGETTGLKSLVLKVLLPIATHFPWMALTFLITLGVVALRWFLTRTGTAVPSSATRPRTKTRGTPRTGGKAGGRRRADGTVRERRSARSSTTATGTTPRKTTRAARTSDHSDERPTGGRRRAGEPARADQAAVTPPPADRAGRRRAADDSDVVDVVERRTRPPRGDTPRTATPRPTGRAAAADPDTPRPTSRAAAKRVDPETPERMAPPRGAADRTPERRTGSHPAPTRISPERNPGRPEPRRRADSEARRSAPRPARPTDLDRLEPETSTVFPTSRRPRHS
ncbi:MAG: hypothetical protein QM662_11505 [Gordonia sp. (in: high G+C Gram-positive bacteria)]